MAIKYTESGMVADLAHVLTLHGFTAEAAEAQAGDFQHATDWARAWLGYFWYVAADFSGCSTPDGCPDQLETFVDAWISVTLTILLGEDDDGSDEDKGNEYDTYCYELRRAERLVTRRENRPPYWELPWETRMATREVEAVG